MKAIKTNAMRFLEKHKVAYETIQYECDEFTDGIAAADKCGVPYEQSFKTLLGQGKSGTYYVFVIPVALELDLKAAAKTVQEKSAVLVHVKDIRNISGYIRGGVSPLGMKKQYMTVIDSSAQTLEEMIISGGRLGLSLKVRPGALASVIGAEFAPICTDRPVR